jgi:4-hydroxybenzoate decarboxylase subunit C
MRGVASLRQFLDLLRQAGELVEVAWPVDPTLELAEIHRRVAAADGPALLFRNVKGSTFPVATNLFGSIRRLELAFPNRPEQLVADLVTLATREFPPSPSTLWRRRGALGALLRLGLAKRRRGPVTEISLNDPDLTTLPLLKSWPRDGGHFLTLPLVYTESPAGGSGNLGIYRMQRYCSKTMGLHWQIQKGGGFHFDQAERRALSLPVTVFLGGPPALMISAIAPLPESVPELILASLLQGGSLCVIRQQPHNLIAECEFALIGEALPGQRQLEGPFGDHYGYYSLAHDFPVFHCRRMLHRRAAVYPATVVGKPRQEDYYIGNYLQRLLAPLFPVVMPGVCDLWSYGETGFHSLTAAVVKERYERECMTSAFRILGEGQLALSKFLLLTDQQVDLADFPTLLTKVLERFRPETDLFIFSNLSLDTLDYTGPALNKGSRGVMLGIGEKRRELPQELLTAHSRAIRKARPFCPGCLVVEGEVIEKILKEPAVTQWPLLILVDDLGKAMTSLSSFLWTVFTRFEPAADIHTLSYQVHRHHLCYCGPLLIDARMKPSYPPEVACDEETARKVTENWKQYFPRPLAMGESGAAHVC